MAVCEKAEKQHSDADLIICITTEAANIIKTNIPFRLILPILDTYNNDPGNDAGVVSLIANVADTISANMIIIERDENEIVVVFYSTNAGARE
jgi:hypothetical protein